MIGRTVSHFHIIEKLGEGGMGVVYKAEDTKLNRFVALKFLHQRMQDGDAARRFTHEAQAASALEHPNICAIHEINETPDGQMYIVMPCYEGEPLHKKIERGQLSMDEALEIGIQIASGLARAHEKGIIHRDIKPGNILLTKDGAKIVDFGLAKLTTQTKLTRTGMTLGTVQYMSPEQAAGGEVDHRSDIWSLGVILYEMVTGRAPFRGKYEQALVYSILNEEPDLVTAVRKDVPAELEDIIAKALAKKPEARYQSAAELVSALTALRQELSIAPEGKTERRVSKTARRRALRRRLRVGIPAVVVTVAAVLALLLIRSAKDASRSQNLAIAVIEFRNSVNPDDPTVSSGITGLVQVGLTETSPIRVISPELLSDIRRRLFGAQRGPIAPDQILEVARKAGSTMYVAGEIVGTAAEQYVTWHLVDTKSGKSLGARRVMGRTLMELADGIIHGVLPLLPRPAEGKVPESVSSVSEIVTSSKEAYEHYVRAKLAVDDVEKVAAGGRDRAIAELQKAIAIDSTFALAYAELAAQLFDRADKQDLKNLTEKAWAYRDRLGLLHRMILEGYREELDGNVPAAMTTYREIHARWPDNKVALTWLTATAHFYWYLEEAVTISAQGMALYPDDMVFLSINRSALREMGRGEEVLQRWIATAGEHPTPWLWSELGENYLAQGFPDSAEACYRRASFESPGDRERIIADCFYARGDVEHAIRMREALMKQPGVNREHRKTLLYGKAAGLVYYMAEIGRFNRSIELLHEYESVVSESKGAIPEEIYLLVRMGQAAKAVDFARTRLKSTTTAIDSLNFNLELIEALAAAGSAREARLLLTAVLELDENVLWGARRYRALLLRSVVSLAEGDPEGALKAIHETERMAKPSVFLRMGVAYRETLARAYWKSGRFNEAVSTYEALLKVFGGHAISHYELGQVYEQMKRPADAKKEYAKFLEMCSMADKGWRPVEDARKRLAAL